MTPQTGSRKSPLRQSSMGPAAGADRLIKDIKSIDKKDICIALSGGRSAAKFYQLIKPRLADLKDKELRLFLLDERISTRHRNSSQIAKALGIKNIPALDIPPPGIKGFHALGTGNGQALLKDYSRRFMKSGCGSFDIIIAGVGEDGHIASLFPGSAHLASNAKDTKAKAYLLVKDSPKPPRMRITASPAIIQKARFKYLLFIGKEKKDAYSGFMDPKKDTIHCPAKLASGKNTRIITRFD